MTASPRKAIRRMSEKRLRALGGRAFSTVSKPSSLPRRSAPKKKRRSKAEFARIYGSKERVLFVKGLPCCACGFLGDSENAHIGTGGMGRKADAASVVPLCGSRFTPLSCHRRLHRWGRADFEKHWGIDLEKCAEATEKLWLAHTEEGK